MSFGAKNEDKRKPNLSWGDDAALPHDADTLRVSFSLKIMGQLDQPTSLRSTPTVVLELRVLMS